ncbi:stage V sporulation protein AD [Terribacillus aidingensis]|uniref:Stage V sporulation protein AD n=1 Tax=Terribacillus aidingensis TaxID=586416 RepID=A0A285NS19_9BACI|nr:stage V sporulation protein AD [Terribacillus aidingensis]SNZ10461.1 stage V sporulation protein AD [Terribacillus aidingensis]
MAKLGRQSWTLNNAVYIEETGTSVGPKEGNGPLGSSFDKSYENLYCGEDNWEMAERKLLQDSIQVTLDKAGLKPQHIDMFIAGDLLNQNVSANYTARDMDMSYLGMFGACSTSMETLAIASQLVDAGAANRILTAVSSHNATAERQFRFPTEYGNQKPETATSTATGAGCALVSREKSKIRIEGATIGKVVDFGATNAFDLGSAMVPAAHDTIKRHLSDFGRTPADYDLIVTGDLSSVGSPILKDMLRSDGIDIDAVHKDCGNLLYTSDQGMLAGGSGTACSAIVTYGHLLDEMKKGTYKRILITATGALMSPTVIRQKESIPAIAHSVVLVREEG